jgi:ADP-ribosylglycohydrolase
LGAFFEFSHGNISRRITERKPPAGEWHWTDDTHMALSLFSVLRQEGFVEQDQFAKSLAQHYQRSRGYGMASRSLIRQIRDGKDWRVEAKNVFGGQGSYGNGCASRVPVVGAFFADDLELVAEQAQDSAPITHAHPEAIAGAIAVAVGTALAWQTRTVPSPGRSKFINQIIPFLPSSDILEKLKQACDLSPDISVSTAAEILGNGTSPTVQTTVPFAVWCAGEILDNYEEAIWLTLEGQGDCDTTCAIVGGIVVMRAGLDGIPALWKEAIEPFPKWAFEET